MLDDKFKIAENGHEFNRADFEDLLKIVDCQNFQISKLKAIHLNCTSSARQNVKLASELLSKSTSCLMQDFFKECPKKQQLSQIISTIDTGFNLMTSKLSDSDHSDFSKRPLGGILDIHSKQLAALYEWMELLENLRFQYMQYCICEMHNFSIVVTYVI